MLNSKLIFNETTKPALTEIAKLMLWLGADLFRGNYSKHRGVYVLEEFGLFFGLDQRNLNTYQIQSLQSFLNELLNFEQPCIEEPVIRESGEISVRSKDYLISADIKHRFTSLIKRKINCEIDSDTKEKLMVHTRNLEADVLRITYNGSGGVKTKESFEFSKTINNPDIFAVSHFFVETAHPDYVAIRELFDKLIHDSLVSDYTSDQGGGGQIIVKPLFNQCTWAPYFWGETAKILTGDLSLSLCSQRIIPKAEPVFEHKSPLWAS